MFFSPGSVKIISLTGNMGIVNMFQKSLYNSGYKKKSPRH